MDPGAPPSPAAPSTKLILGKYELGRLLGEGSFAKVYHARYHQDNSSVAIKIIDKSKTDSSAAPRIITEIAAMRRLNHPNVVQIHEVLATKTKIYIVMELAAGGDLFGKLARRPDGRFPERMALRYFHQIITALHFCHGHGVAHRDIKPPNILLADDGATVKLSDFGLAAVESEGTRGLLLRTACGTPGYAAPEVMLRRGGPYDGAKADVWSCGVILYVMLVGALPFTGYNYAVMYRNAQRGQVQFPGHVTRPARALIRQLLSPDPDARLTIHEIMENEWFNAAQFRPRSLSLGDMVSLNEKKNNIGNEFDLERVASMNAFDIIGMNSGLDISGLLDGGDGKKERRFISKAPVDEVAARVAEVGVDLGYDVEKRGGGKIWLGKGKLLLVFEFLEMGPDLLVEMRVVHGGGCGPCGGCVGGFVEERQWGEIKSGLGDVVFSWHSVGV